MKIEVWRLVEEEPDGLGGISELYSEPPNVLQALVDLRKCQMEHGSTEMSITLLDIEDGDV